MQRLATPAVVLGLAGLVAGGLLRLFRPSWSAAWPAALIVAGLVLVFGLYLSLAGSATLRGALTRRTTRYGLNAAVMVILILGVIALVEAVSYRHNWRLDLTENRRHSLASQTTRVLKELPVAVKALAFFRPDQPGKRAAEDLFRQYESRADGKFTWEVVDADRQPLRAKQYAVESYGTVVLEATAQDGQPKTEKLTEADEEKLTNALIRVTRAGKRVVYFVKGHGERDPESSEKTGLSQVKAAVEKINYQVKDVLLARETRLPDDAAIVVVAGPQKDLLPNELEALTAYLDRAGKVFLMVDPFQAPGLRGLLDRYGLGLGEDLIVDFNPQGQLLGAGPEIPVVGDYQDHPITRGFRFATLFPVARSVTVTDKPPEGVTTQVLARTSGESWGETNQDELRTGQVKPDGKDTRGPLAIAAVATGPAPGVPEGRKDAKARVVLVGDSDFATNSFLNISGNRDFFLNTLSWLAEEENLIAVRPREQRSAPVFLTAAQGYVLFWVPVILLPLAVVVAGGYAMSRRRGR